MVLRGHKAKGLLLLTSWLAVGGSVGGCGRPAGVLFEPVDPPVVWPAAPERARIRWVGAIASSRDLHAATSGAEVFKAALRGPRPPISFDGPHAVALSGGRLLAVADAAGGAVHLIDLRDRTHLRLAGWGEERLGSPVGVVWAGGRLLVSDAARHEVMVFDKEGNFHRRFGGDTLLRPVGIAYAPSRDRLYVVDGGAHCIRLFDLSGRPLGTIGRRGTAEGSFNFPSHICIAGRRLAVADSGNFRVQLLDLDGGVLGTVGRKGDGAGDFSLPKGVAFDGDGHLYVVDAQFENVQIFDRSGRLLMAFGEEGGGPGRFSLPAGLAIDGGGRIWVADAGNRRVCVFDYLADEESKVKKSKSQKVEKSKSQKVKKSRSQTVGTARTKTFRVRPKTSVAQASRLCLHRRDGGATRLLGCTPSRDP